MTTIKKTALVMTVAAALISGRVLAQKDWVYFGQDQGASKYSTLDQINTDNVSTLTRAWTFHTGDPSGFFESTPLVIGDFMYLSAQNGFYALDPITGVQKWKYDATQTTRRGVSYWPGDSKAHGRIIASTGNKMIALDATTGEPVAGFGEKGFVDMENSMPSPPTIYKDMIITPGSKPVIRAWSARTGKLLWTFNLIPQAGDANNKTWENDAWKTIGGTNVWGYLTVDPVRGILYIPNSIAGADYNGVPRPGDNLYGTSLVAIDVNTGRLKWFQQFVHHDIWDFDLAAPPTLFDSVQNGKKIPAVAQITKMGLLFTFDRTTGKPLFGMEERPVPQSDVPGEKTSPTQPFPLKPAPLARMSMTKAELPTGITPEHTAYCQGLWDKYKLQDSVPYTPWGFNRDIVVYPGAVGGGNWNGVSYNPKLGLLFTNVMNAGQWGHIEIPDPNAPARGGGRGGRGAAGDPAAAGRGAAGDPAAAAGRGGRGGRQGADPDGEAPTRTGPQYRKVTPEGGRFWDPRTMYSCVNPPWGELVAVNANTGDIAWHVPLGKFAELEAKGIKTGTPSLGGGITTAGNLVFIGATVDGFFRAFDARTGKELWEAKLDAPAHSIPSTYMGRDGKQYVVVSAGGGGFLRSPTSDAVIAFALPAKGK